MLNSLIVLLLLSFKSLFAIPCGIDRAGPASAITTCLKSIPKNNTELENFVGTIIEYTKNSPYALLFMGGPNGLTPFDTPKDLQSLKTQAAVWDKSVLEFYEKIHDIVGRLKDPHATVIFPFLTSFAYMLPYGFAPVSDKENSFRLTPNIITAAYNNDPSRKDYTGYIIDEMDLKSGGLTFRPAAEAFSELALDVGNAGHNPHALFNSIIKKNNVFQALELFRPEERYNANVFLKGKDTDGVDKTVSIPWLGYYSGDENAQTFDDLNPVVPAPEPAPVPEPAPTPGRRRNGEKDMDKNSMKLFLPRFLRNEIPPVFVEDERMLEKIKRQLGVGRDFSADSGRYESRLITSTYEKMLSARRSSRSLGDALPIIDLEKIYEELSGGECTIYVDATNRIGYIRYTTFMQGGDDDSVTFTFLEEFGKKYKEMVDKEVTDVIFDVRGNTGGKTFLVEEFTDFFFHNTIYPADLDSDVLLGTGAGMEMPTAGWNYLEVMGESLAGAEVLHYKVVDGAEQRIDNRLEPPVTKTHVNAVEGSSSTFSANYTQRGFYNIRHNTTIREAYGGYSPFDPQHFYIITDGVCASCCGIFTKLAVETKAARVLGYGVNPTKKSDISTYVPGNCAGSLMGTEEVERMRTTVKSLSESLPQEILDTLPPVSVLLAMLPPTFERDGVSFGVTDYEFFSRHPLHTNETLYMVPAHVAEVLPLQVSSEAETIDVLKEIAAVVKSLYIDNPTGCVAGEVLVDDGCQTDERIAAHQLWGKTCVGSPGQGQPTGNCAFAHCETGYYLSGVDATSCAAIPNWPKPVDPPVDPPVVTPNAGAVVSVPVLLLPLVFAVLMFR